MGTEGLEIPEGREEMLKIVNVWFNFITGLFYFVLYENNPETYNFPQEKNGT